MSDFGLDIAKWCAKAGDRADLVVRKVSIDMFARIVMRSPVDTGRFRANWLVTVNSGPAKGTRELFDKPGHETIAAGAAVIAGARAGQVIWFTNNLTYAKALEYGHSKQAPGGMVRITIAEFQALINQAQRD